MSKRNTYNYTSLLNTSYADIKSIKKLLRNYFRLYSLAEKGINEAMCLLCDILMVMDDSFMINFEHLLSKQQKKVIYYHLILDMKQEDVARIMGITQEAVSLYLKHGLVKIMRSLGEYRDKGRKIV